MNVLAAILAILVIVFGALAYMCFQKNKIANDRISVLEAEISNKESALERYSGIVNLEAEQKQIRAESDSLQVKIDSQKEEGRKLSAAIKDLNHQLADLNDQNAIQEYGLYKPKYDFGTSDEYKSKLQAIRQDQKDMIKNNDAVHWGQNWVVAGSKEKGQAMMREGTKITLRAFNGECESLILKVKYNNVQRIEERIKKTHKAIDKLRKSDQCTINPKYVDLKLQELYLVHEYREKVQAEKEEQRQIREQMREEQRAQRELEKAQQEAEKEEQRYQKALEKAQAEAEKATGEKQAKLQEEIDKLNQMLEEAHTAKERAVSRAQMTKSGHVYIISNVGSFGENVYKIGMTRRLDPLDRVKELGDASVPFLFDVHAMIYSENAPELESNLHKVFSTNRINLVNHRKEYFNVGIGEIEKVVKSQSPEAEFVLTAEAEEYRKTIAMREAQQNVVEQQSSVDEYSDLFA